MKSQHEPASITRNIKQIAVVISKMDYQKSKLQALRTALIEGEESGNAGTLDIEDIKRKARLKASISSDADNS